MTEPRVRTIDESTLETVLAEDVEFEGELRFSRPLLIRGKVQGQIISDTDLYISADADVAATVEAAKVSVKGHVSGDVHARTRLELFASARVDGNIRTPDLIVQSGCRLNGSCVMDQPAEGGSDA